jgi:hypothetical protein
MLAATAILLAQCSGSGGTGTTIPTTHTTAPTSTPTASAAPSATPTPAHTTAPTSAPTATAVPTATATPTASPVPSLAASPTSLTFNNTGYNCGAAGSATCAQSFTAGESGYSGHLNASSGNTGIVTLTPAQGSGPSAAFTVMPVSAGTTTITITDANGKTATVGVTVSTMPVTVQSLNMKGH